MKIFIFLIVASIASTNCNLIPKLSVSEESLERCTVHKQLCLDGIGEDLSIDCTKLKNIECRKDFYDGKLIKSIQSHSISKRSTVSKCSRLFSGYKCFLYFCMVLKDKRGCKHYGKCSWYCSCFRNDGKCKNDPFYALLQGV